MVQNYVTKLKRSKQVVVQAKNIKWLTGRFQKRNFTPIHKSEWSADMKHVTSPNLTIQF